MTDLTNYTGKTLERQTLDLKSKPKLTLQSLRPKSVLTKTVILADISGSMSGHKMNCLKDALHKVWSPHIEGIAFESNLWSFGKQDINQLQAQGTTHMKEALIEAWSTNPGHIVLLTDGYANGGSSEVLDEVRHHPTPPIDTVGIGGHGDYDRQMLEQIALLTNGRFMDVAEPLKLTETLEELLQLESGKLDNQAIESIQL